MSLLPHITRDYIIKGVPKNFDVHEGVGEFLFQKLRENGKFVAMVDAGTGKELTAEDILNDAVTVAEALRGMGVRPGDMIGFCSENRLEYPIPVAATLFVGASCAPLNPIYTIQELKHTMNISQPSIVFCSPFTAAKILEVQTEMPFLKKIIVFGEVETDETFIAFNDLLRRPGNPAAFAPAKVDFKNSVCVVLCSSGTTGLPKGVELTDYNMRVFVDNLLDPRLAGDMSDEIILGLIPFFHGYGFGIMLVSLIRSIKVIVMSMFDEKQFLESIQNYKVTQLFSVPPLLVFLAKHPLVDKYDLSSLTRIRCGAAPLSKEVQLAVQKRLNIADIKQGYGMTELSIACVFSPLDRNKMGSSGIVTPGMDCKVFHKTDASNILALMYRLDKNNKSKKKYDEPLTVKHILDECKKYEIERRTMLPKQPYNILLGNNETYLESIIKFITQTDTGKALPSYREGELCFKGPFVMKGYRNNKKATDETIDKDGWLHTGDIGYYDIEGFIFIVDRLKELIKYKGFQVPPAELEAILLTHPGVKDAAVIGIPDDDAGELPFAFIVRQPDMNPTEDEIKKFVSEKVSAQKRLAGGVRFVEEIPKNPSGKILRRELRTLYKTTSKL